MAHARAQVELTVPASGAEALWYDTTRWPMFVDGFGHVVKIEGDWPEAGSRVVWDSAPEGRGRVVERVTAYEVRAGQTVEVEDPRLTGTQRVVFTPRHGGCTMALELRYELKGGGFFAPVVDLLFVRRAVVDALRRTLLRFRREVEAEAELAETG
jgi:uncharacterized membrane protein